MSTRNPHRLTFLGWGLAVPVLFLTAIGLGAIHVTDRNAEPGTLLFEGLPAAAEEVGWLAGLADAVGPTTIRQAMYFLTGVALLALTLLPSYQKIGRFSYALYGLVLVLLGALVLDRYIDVPLVPVIRSTRRWIDLHFFRIQPSEFMKVALILALARYLRFRSSYRTLPGLLPPFLLTLGPMVLILLQPDLGTLLMLLPALFAMLFVAGARLRHLLLIVVLGCATMPMFYLLGMKDYQRQRIMVVFRQNTPDERWHRNEGYQLRQSKLALATGGVWGAGFGQGIFIEHALLPEEHNDFIFAIIGHQWGLIGCLLVIGAYVVLVFFGLEVAMVTNDPFGRLLAVGVIVMVVVQALLNMSMTIGLAPITGMTLPFVSFGGSSLWANFIALGLLLNVAQRRPMLIGRPPFAHDEE
jgi:rod shape determining protein RodA